MQPLFALFLLTAAALAAPTFAAPVPPASASVKAAEGDPVLPAQRVVAAKPTASATLADLKSSVGKHILVTGTWSNTRSTAQIALTRPSQIKVIQ